jgi:hypothetical protein
VADVVRTCLVSSFHFPFRPGGQSGGAFSKARLKARYVLYQPRQ